MKILTKIVEIEDYLRDESNLKVAYTQAVYLPNSETDIVEVLKLANQKRLSVTISGARTGLVGGAVPQLEGIVLSLAEMSKLALPVLDPISQKWTMTVGPAVSLSQIKALLETKFPKLIYPPDPTELSASIGGTVATNASGARSFKFGPTRNYIQCLHVILADGTLLNIARGEFIANAAGEFVVANRTIKIPDLKMPKTKHCAGYFCHPKMDLIDLFIGSEGTLGIISEIQIELVESSKEHLALLMFLPAQNHLVSFVNDLRAERQQLDLEAIEFFDAKSLQLLETERQKGSLAIAKIPSAEAAIYIELSYLESDFDEVYFKIAKILKEAAGNLDDSWAGTDHSEIEKLKIFRHALPETVNRKVAQIKKHFPQLHKISTDMAVPDEGLAELLALYQQKMQATNLNYVIFGHIGDNHLHLNILPESPQELELAKQTYFAFAQKAVALGGTISAEHGIGKIKSYLLPLMFSEAQLNQMKALKHKLDPNGILGQGNIFG